MSTAESTRMPETSGLLIHRAKAYDLLLWLLSLGRERTFRERVLRRAQLKPGERVLDIGCGTGTMALLAKRQVGPAGEVCGIDASPAMIARARQKSRSAGTEIRFSNAVVESLPFPNDHFDVVLSTVMLHHLPSRVRTQCAQEVQRVLRPGGRVLAVDFGTSPAQRKGIVAHFHRHGHISLEEIVSMLREAGLSVAESGPAGIGDLQFALAVKEAR